MHFCQDVIITTVNTYDHMSASAEMPYFINPSLILDAEAKEVSYAQAKQEINLCLDKDSSIITKMATINCILKTHLPYFYWVGFYMLNNGRLEVGPYQGTLGCIYIDIGQGVCGKAAKDLETQIVPDCHLLVQGAEHIACDPNSRSEIVVPVFGKDNELIAVFDVDSTLEESFDSIDKRHLEDILNSCFSN